MSVLAEGGAFLQDGFQEVLSYSGHKLQVRGVSVVELSQDSSSSSTGKNDVFISWDTKSVMVWERDPLKATSLHDTHALQRYFFPKNQPAYLSSIVYITKLKVFLASALDMSFKVFDRNFKLLESINHEERAILSMEYDAERSILLCAGASGISAWRFYRNLSLDGSHVIEKLFSFEGCEGWVGVMIFEPKTNRVYALSDKSVSVLSFRRRAVISKLENIHDSPVTRVCWYGRSQFYLTGCSRGFIKCWTSHYRKKHLEGGGFGGAAAAGNTTKHGEDDEVTEGNFALLHTFPGHSKAITGLALHTTPGLAISASMDGTIKILNLEAFNELFSVHLGVGITNLKTIGYGPNLACLFCKANGDIRLWRVTSCCEFFGISSAEIESLATFENLQIEPEKISLETVVDQVVGFKKDAAGEESIAGGDEESGIGDGGDSEDKEASLVSGAESPLSGSDSEESDGEDGSSISSDGDESGSLKEGEGDGADQGASGLRDAGLSGNRYLVSQASQDLRVFGSNGALLCRVDPTEIVEGIRSYAVSVFQQMLFCLLERGNIKVYCCRSLACPLLRDFPHIHSADGSRGTVVTLLNVRPNGAATVKTSSSGKEDKDARRHTFRGDDVPNAAVELLAVGTSSGTVIVLDTFGECEVCFSLQAVSGPVLTMKYRRARNEFFVFGTEENSLTTLKIWTLPKVDNPVEVSKLDKISSFEIAPYLGYFGFGCKDGYVRLFCILQPGDCQEVLKQGLTHEGPVVSISFCDEVRIYCTCSEDLTVKVWDYEKQFIRSVKLNMLPCGAIFNGSLGDILISQRAYILEIPREVWDEGGYVQQVREAKDPWQDSIERMAKYDDKDIQYFNQLLQNKQTFMSGGAGGAEELAESGKDGKKTFITEGKKKITDGKSTRFEGLEVGSQYSDADGEMARRGSSESLEATARDARDAKKFRHSGIIDVRHPRFHMVPKPPIQFQIPEIDTSEAMAKELEKEEQMMRMLAAPHRRSRNGPVLRPPRENALLRDREGQLLQSPPNHGLYSDRDGHDPAVGPPSHPLSQADAKLPKREGAKTAATTTASVSADATVPSNGSKVTGKAAVSKTGAQDTPSGAELVHQMPQSKAKQQAPADQSADPSVDELDGESLAGEGPEGPLGPPGAGAGLGAAPATEESLYIGRKIASLGMSPRARIALLSVHTKPQQQQQRSSLDAGDVGAPSSLTSSDAAAQDIRKASLTCSVKATYRLERQSYASRDMLLSGKQDYQAYSVTVARVDKTVLYRNSRVSAALLGRKYEAFQQQLKGGGSGSGSGAGVSSSSSTVGSNGNSSHVSGGGTHFGEEEDGGVLLGVDKQHTSRRGRNSVISATSDLARLQILRDTLLGAAAGGGGTGGVDNTKRKTTFQNSKIGGSQSFLVGGDGGSGGGAAGVGAMGASGPQESKLPTLTERRQRGTLLKVSIQDSSAGGGASALPFGNTPRPPTDIGSGAVGTWEK